MTCLEVRQTLLVNPEENTSEILRHLEQCPACKAFHRSLMNQDEKLKSALEIPVPPKLSERVLLANNLTPHSNRRWMWMGGVAASFLVMALGFNGVFKQSTDPSWGEVAIMHVLNEEKALNAEGNISEASVNEALASFGLAETGHLGRVRYLEHCEMPGGAGLHVVVEHEALGVFTLVLPPQGVIAQSNTAKRKGLVAQFVSIGGTSVGVVTSETVQEGAIKQWVANQIISKSTL
jgi:hypothetical protein